MRVAFVVQRYGENVVGGAEQGCRQLAQLMSKDWQVSVITTCAKNYLTWENEFLSGESKDGDVSVHRFPVDKPRDFASFSENSALQERNAYRLSADDEVQRFIDQGPYTPQLVKFIEENRDKFDRFIFYTYLYYTTVAALPFVAEKSYLVTTAHDEPPLYFIRTYAPLFHSLRGILFLSEAERQLVNQIYRIPSQVKQIICGLPVTNARKFSEQEWRELDAKWAPKIGNDPIILYVGRIAPAKGCQELLECFTDFRTHHKIPLSLVLVGATELEIPDKSFIKYLGYVDERDKSYLIQKSIGLINPSHLESFSIVIMEAWQNGRPVVVNAASDVMRNYCDESNGGLYYHSRRMFKAVLEWMLFNQQMGNQLGAQGQKFVRNRFSPEAIRQTLLQSID